MHKGADELIGEVVELAKEIDAIEAYKLNLFRSIGRITESYRRKKLGYVEYEAQLNSVLNGRSKAEWRAYYDSSQYALLKKIEFIITQAYRLVEDDRAYLRLSLSKKPAAELGRLARLPDEPAKGVFSIDNEIARLKGILAKGYPASEVKAERGSLSIKIPGLDSLKEEVSRAESAAKRRAESIAVEKAARPAVKAEVAAEPSAALTVKASKELSPSKPSPPKRRLRLPRLHLGALGLNLSPRQALAELKAAKAFVLGIFRRMLSGRSAKGAAHGGVKAASKAPKDMISFSDIVFEDEHPSKKKKKAEPAGEKRKTPFLARLKSAFGARKRRIFVEDIVSMERSMKGEKPEDRYASGEAGIAFGWFSPKRLLYEFTGRFKRRQEPILAEQTAIPVHMKKLREMRKKLYHEERLSGFDATLLAQEAKRIKRILEVEKQEVYKGSSLGLIANVTVRKISLFLVNNFPQFFGYLYNALRAANVKVLSNTYVNIMVLVTLMLTGAVFFLMLVLFFILNHPIYQIFLRSVIFALIAGAFCAAIFYVYPFMKIRERRRKTTTNLPFAINHMSAVATSGVPPARMFELIAQSGEYEEVGVEVKKIVDFTNIFGYDLLTAINAVSSTTPSLPFKKFLDGMVSTIETGGDLVSYLRQEADEAALTYKLERQRYNETVSTYSDIYTGVLIAAPLFFIAAMALVNLLGGTLGGLGVGTVMALGAYLVIPILNIGFIIFLQMTQPEV